MKRTCKKCQEEKTMDNFGINVSTTSKTYYKHTCKDCRGKQKETLRKLHSENKKPEKAICPICNGTDKKMVLDHNHTTNEFRGWICNDCNNALGKFKDSIEILNKAINYLSK